MKLPAERLLWRSTKNGYYGDESTKNLLHLCLKGLDEGGATHGLCLDNVVVQQLLDVVDGRQDGGARLSVGDDCELHLSPKTKVAHVLDTCSFLVTVYAS